MKTRESETNTEPKPETALCLVCGTQRTYGGLLCWTCERNLPGMAADRERTLDDLARTFWARIAQLRAGAETPGEIASTEPTTTVTVIQAHGVNSKLRIRTRQQLL